MGNYAWEGSGAFMAPPGPYAVLRHNPYFSADLSGKFRFSPELNAPMQPLDCPHHFVPTRFLEGIFAKLPSCCLFGCHSRLIGHADLLRRKSFRGQQRFIYIVGRPEFQPDSHARRHPNADSSPGNDRARQRRGHEELAHLRELR